MRQYADILARAKQVIPGGINSCIRNYPENFITIKGDGAYFWDQTGKRYTDYLCAYGPIILGYAYQPVREKVKQAIDRYDLYGVGTCDVEVALAEKLCGYMKGVDRVLLCTGGSEATYHAIRCARAYTKRKKIIKMQGAFHGWHDFVLMNVISKKENLYKRDLFSEGILEGAAKETLICRINDFEDLEKKCKDNEGDVAAIILDPYMTTFGCMRMQDSYVEAVRKLCDEKGIILIFDEVVTGMRIGLGGASSRFDVTPDLTAMGKAMANGYPVAALGGKAEIMDTFNTTQDGKVSYQATYYGNAIMAAASLATIEELEKPGVYEHMEEMGDLLCSGLEEIAARLGIDFYTEHCGSLIGLYFGTGPNYNLDDCIAHIDTAKSVEFRKRMIDRGHYFSPGDYKRCVINYSHTREDIMETLNAAESVFKEIYKKG